jgi:hypothetical protein
MWNLSAGEHLPPRSNLAAGGTVGRWPDAAAGGSLAGDGCGRFYAHIDLQLTAEGVCYLSEIASTAASPPPYQREELNRRKQAQLEKS